MMHLDDELFGDKRNRNRQEKEIATLKAALDAAAERQRSLKAEVERLKASSARSGRLFDWLDKEIEKLEGK